MLWVVSVFAGFLCFGDLTCLGLPGSGTVEMCTSPCNLGQCPAPRITLEGTNVEKGKALINASGLNIISANDLDDAAKKACAAL